MLQQYLESSCQMSLNTKTNPTADFDSNYFDLNQAVQAQDFKSVGSAPVLSKFVDIILFRHAESGFMNQCFDDSYYFSHRYSFEYNTYYWYQVNYLFHCGIYNKGVCMACKGSPSVWPDVYP